MIAQIDPAAVMRQNSKTFHFAALFLPARERLAIQTIYAFCRSTDDIADLEPDKALARTKLQALSQGIQSGQAGEDKLLAAFLGVLNDFSIPKIYPIDLIAGCEQDLGDVRFKTYAQLSEYCYRVASTVGLMSVHVLGFDQTQRELVLAKAIEAGIALQLTNIIRDVGEDLTRGRIYIPEEDFLACHCPYEEQSGWGQSEQFKKLIRLQVLRAQDLYQSARPALVYLSPVGRLAVTAALRLYEEILWKVVGRDYQVLGYRAHTTLLDKLGLLPEIFWDSFKQSPRKLPVG